MSKLEEKLIELGYKNWFTSNCCSVKFYHKYIDEVEIEIHIKNGKIINHYGYPRNDTFKQSQIDNLQQAFNQLQKDLEVLKEYE